MSGLAIFGYDLRKDNLFLPIEYEVKEKEVVYLVNNYGERLGEGIIEKVLHKPNKTNIARVKALDVHGEDGEGERFRGEGELPAIARFGTVVEGSTGGHVYLSVMMLLWTMF